MICCCKSSGYGACVVVFNDYVRYIERLNFFACQHTESIVLSCGDGAAQALPATGDAAAARLSSNGAAAVAFFVAGKSLLIGCDGDGTAPHSKC